MINLIIGLWVIFAIYIVYLIFSYYKQKYLIKKFQNTPFPDEYKQYLLKIKHYNYLDNKLKRKIETSIMIFINTKKFIGVKLNVTDEIKVVISFYACLIVLNKNECYDGLEVIYVYPYTMILDSVRGNGGIYTKEDFLISGEAVGDAVVIAWDEAKRDVYHYRNQNVIVHEFTHELDFESGIVNGIPPLERSKYNEWVNIMSKNYDEFVKRVTSHKNLDKYKLINPYGATNEAEFFAVLSEMFWMKPKTLKLHFPDIYDEFMKFFGIDTYKMFISNK